MIEGLTNEIDNEAKATKKLLEKVPNDKLDWKPHEKSMTLGKLAQHIATTYDDFGKCLKVDTFDMSDFTQSEELKSTEEIVAAHEKYMPPSWMKANGGELSVEIVTLPDAEAAEQAVDIRQVIEFYSRN